MFISIVRIVPYFLQFGDNDTGYIQLPAFTLCYADKMVLREKLGCGQEWDLFMDMAAQCSMEDHSLTVDGLIERLAFDRQNYVSAYLTPDYMKPDDEELQKLLWTPTVHPYYGYCYTFNSAKVF